MTKTIGSGRSPVIAAAIAILAGLSASQLMAKTVAVGTCVAGVTQYSTIQSAVTAVPAGSTIKVCPGNYPEQVVINKKLTLTGVASRSSDNPVLVMPAGGFVANTTGLYSGEPLAAQILVQNTPADSVDISDLAVDGTNSTVNCANAPLIGIYYRDASGRINYVAARNQAQQAGYIACPGALGLGIFVESASPATSTVTIANSTVRGYLKNGITADEVGTTITINGNTVVGAGPIGLAQNGIQVGFGASGIVENNSVADDIFSGDPSEGVASGILIYDSGNLEIKGNSVTTTQIGIPIVTDGLFPADDNTVTNNQVINTVYGDGIDLCSSNNTVTGNSVFSSNQGGIHLDSSCGSTGNNNTVSNNAVNEACAGILLGSGSGNTISTNNTIANVANTTLAGDVCPAVAPAALPRGQVTSHGRSSRAVRP
jgi:parallel beta-helix repeat protein